MAVFFVRRGSPPSLGTRLGDLEIGTIVHIKENGVYQDYLVVNQGLPSSMYDSSCDGTWLLRKDIYSEQQWNSSDRNVYASSTIHTYLNGTFYNLFEVNIKNSIKQIKIPYVNGTGLTGSVASGSNGLSTKIFLLSGYEVGYSMKDNLYFPVDGAKLAYFESGTGDGAFNKRVANYNGSATDYWLRSPFANAREFIWTIYAGNGYSDVRFCTSLLGVRPAFTLSADLMVDSNNNIF